MSNLPTFSGTQGAKERANDGLDSEEFIIIKSQADFGSVVRGNVKSGNFSSPRGGLFLKHNVHSCRHSIFKNIAMFFPIIHPRITRKNKK